MVARVLLVLSLVPLGLSIWLAFTRVENPGVQDCGTPVAFIVQGRTNVRLPRLGDPEFTPDTPRLNAQPRCTERVDERLAAVAAWGGAFVGMALLGAVLGLIDDRMRLRREPRFEELLREAPPDAPDPLWDRPVIPVEDLGHRLPAVEPEDVDALVVWGLVAMIAVPALVSGREALDVVDTLDFVPMVIAVLLGAAVPVLAAAPLMAVTGSRLPFRRAVTVVIAGAYLAKAMPAFGWSGVQAHFLVRLGMPADEARRSVGLLTVIAAGVATVFAVVGAFLVLGAGDSGWPPRSLLLVLTVAVALSVGVGLMGIRYRRLVFPLDRSLMGEWSALRRLPLSLAAVVGGPIAQALALGLALVLCVAACGGDASVVAVLAVAWLALGLGAVSPTPGGLLVVESVTVLALSRIGIDPAVAAASTVVWRLATYWLPYLPGAVTSWRLRRAAVL
jgi:undecaprenyl-diphosphatase